MPSETICRTIRQHSSEPISEESMSKLQEIAEDYSRVKNYVYSRFGGVGGLTKLYPGYTVQNEMTGSGLREQLGMPSVYFYLAVFDAIGDIKNQWAQTRNRVLESIKKNQLLTDQERHYLRFALKVSNCTEAILNHTPVRLTGEYQKKYELLAQQVDVRKADHYLRRQVRKHLRKLNTEVTDGFSIAERAYRYADHGIYISTKQKRKRIFVPLTDNHRYGSQLYIKLDKKNRRLQILVPIEVHIKRHENFQNFVGISMGMSAMLTTDRGSVYGKDLGDYISYKTDWVRRQNASYMKNRAENPGREKYAKQKRKLDAGLHTYINAELNRFLREEKPKVIYLPKLPAYKTAGTVKKYNHSFTLWQRGYIRKRLNQKCREQSIKIVEVFGKGISTECSECGHAGERKSGIFYCSVCGLQIEDRLNAAQNVKKRGLGLEISENGGMNRDQILAEV